MEEKLITSNPDQLSLQTITVNNNESNISRFEKHSPFVTLLIMSFGPLVTTLTTNLMDFLELYFLTKRFSQQSLIKPVQLQGFSGFCITIVILIVTYFASAVATRLSRIIGENREKDVIHFFTDITKIAVVFLLTALPLIQFLIHPLLSFMNCPDYLENYCYLYSINVLSASPFILLFYISCAFLQATGRSFLNGFLHIGQSILQVIILTPLFLFVFKVGITLISLQLAISQGIIGLILFILIYSSKFGYEANFLTFGLPIIQDTTKALKNAIPTVLVFICNVGPPIFVLRFLLSTATTPEMTESLAGVNTIYGKVALLSNSVMMAVSNGLLTVGTFSYGARDNRRLLLYFGLAILISVVFGAIFSLFMIIKPQLIAGIYLESETDLSLSNRILKIPFYTSWFSSVSIMCQILLICTGKPLRSSIPSFAQTIIIIFFAYMLSKAAKDRPHIIYFAYNINDIIIFILSVCITIPVIVKLRKEKVSGEDTVTLIGTNDNF